MILLFSSFASAGIELEGPLVIGQEVMLSITNPDGSAAPGETVRVIHHPSSTRSLERAINISDARGRVAWSPTEYGIGELRAGPHTLRVRIQPASVPTSPLTLYILLLLGALGSVAMGLKRRMKE